MRGMDLRIDRAKVSKTTSRQNFFDYGRQGRSQRLRTGGVDKVRQVLSFRSTLLLKCMLLLLPEPFSSRDVDDRQDEQRHRHDRVEELVLRHRSRECCYSSLPSGSVRGSIAISELVRLDDIGGRGQVLTGHWSFQRRFLMSSYGRNKRKSTYL